MIDAESGVLFPLQCQVFSLKVGIFQAEDFHSYAPVWDEDWNRYPDAGALAAAGKETAYAAQVLCGTVDHMQMTQIVVMRYGARDKGTVLYALNADQYIKP